MIRPTAKSLTLQGIGLLLSALLIIVAPTWWVIWVVYVSALLLATVFDAVTLPSETSLVFSWRLPSSVYLEEEAHADFTLQNRNTRIGLQCELQAEATGALAYVEPLSFFAPPQRSTSLRLPLQAWRRGRGGFSKLELRWTGRLGLMQRQLEIPCQGIHTEVFANLRAVQRAGLRWRNAKQYMQGLKIQKHVGDGREFDALREFQPGHDSRAIDWRASARMRSLHVREFREEKNHNVVFAIDSGRLMARNLGDLARLDHALNAALHLSYVSLQAGDRVGVFGFDSETRVWLPPNGGPRALPSVVQAFQALPYTLNVTDFRSAFTFLNEKLKRRSIIVLLTDFEGQQGSDAFLRYVRQLTSKHLVLVVAVGEGGALSLERFPTTTLADLQTAVAASNLHAARQGALHALHARGIRSIDVAPKQIALQLLNAYHDVKRRGLI